MTTSQKLKALFLDRDGTINVDTGYVYKLSDFALEKNVLPGLQVLRDAGFSFFILTNQSGIAKGLYTEKDFETFNNHLIQTLSESGISVLKTYFCPYHPESPIPKYHKDSPLRKPGTGMLELACTDFPIDKKSSWVIGDKWSDVKTGKDFGIRSILLKTGKSGSDTEDKTNPSYVANDMIEAAQFILKETSL